MERCRSGWTGRSRKAVRLQNLRGFESLSLRHIKSGPSVAGFNMAKWDLNPIGWDPQVCGSQGRKPDDECHRLRRVRIASGNPQGNLPVATGLPIEKFRGRGNLQGKLSVTESFSPPFDALSLLTASQSCEWSWARKIASRRTMKSLRLEYYL